MGVFVSIWDKLFGEEDKNFKILILGLDQAGKTTILEKIQGKMDGEPVPTIGYNHQKVRMRNVSLDAWDLSGQERMRKIWKHYFVDTGGIIFVIDCTDFDRIEIAKDELNYLLAEPELMNIPILILANKQDIPEAMGVSQLRKNLGVVEEEHKRRIKIQESSAIQDEGLDAGFEWLVKILTNEEDDE
ncbi:unnamed protein product [Moneuplotes crassus]|uniref:ADP-ribosylation factor n=1 Tax=Euplotes crassus TaxID=5936 RepID=A0AAD1XJC9_EUPCR|nr:unnamed protein product [Moneuplotes crassus]